MKHPICKTGDVPPEGEARFDMAGGRRVDGPAPAGAHLMFLPKRIEGEELINVRGATP